MKRPNVTGIIETISKLWVIILGIFSLVSMGAAWMTTVAFTQQQEKAKVEDINVNGTKFDNRVMMPKLITLDAKLDLLLDHFQISKKKNARQTETEGK